MKKKLLGLFLLCSIALAGCSSPSDSDDRTETQMEPQENAETQPGQSSSVLEEPENILVSSPSVIPPGNVQQLAGWVQEETGGDLFSIRVTDPYPSDWDECLDRANEERAEDARPELVENVGNIEEYDTVFLGYPPVRQTGIFILFPRNRRTGRECGIDHRSCAGRSDLRKYL